MQVVESFIEGKINAQLCEDALVITEHFVAVIDGVSSKTPFKHEGKKTGHIAAELIKQVIEQLPREASLQTLKNRVNLAFADFYAQVAFPYDKEKYGLHAMGAIYSDAHKEIWLIGDCQVIANDELHLNPKKSDLVFEAFRSLISYTDMMHHGITKRDYFAQTDQAREQILPWITAATVFANDARTEWGYSVFNGSDIPDELIKVIPVNNSQEIVLATDGYPQLAQTLAECEDLLQQALATDPYCIDQFKSTKGIQHEQVNSFDDRTYIRFRIN